MTLYLARHGETDWNRQGKMQGRLGATLNELGKTQAAALARAAATLGLERLVASPLARAVETARLVSAATGLPVTFCDALMEIDFGRCSGLTEAEIAERYPTLHAERRADKWHHRWPEGESYADAVARLAAAFDSGALSRAPNTLFIAHQSVNRAFAHLLTGLPVAAVLKMAQRSDVLLRALPDKSLSFATLALGETPRLLWESGPYPGGVAGLN